MAHLNRFTALMLMFATFPVMAQEAGKKPSLPQPEEADIRIPSLEEEREAPEFDDATNRWIRQVYDYDVYAARAVKKFGYTIVFELKDGTEIVRGRYDSEAEATHELFMTYSRGTEPENVADARVEIRELRFPGRYEFVDRFDTYQQANRFVQAVQNSGNYAVILPVLTFNVGGGF